MNPVTRGERSRPQVLLDQPAVDDDPPVAPVTTVSRLLLVSQPALPLLPASLIALDAARLCCLRADPDLGSLGRASRWRAPVAVVLADHLPRAERVTILAMLRAVGDGCWVVLARQQHPLREGESADALDLGFDAVWPPLGGAGAELAARYAAAVVGRQQRLHRAAAACGAVRRIGDLQIGGEPLLARWRGHWLPLSCAQLRLLHALAWAPAQALPRSVLARLNPARDERSPRAVDVCVSRLRRRLRELGVQGVDIGAVREHGYGLRVAEPLGAQ